MSRIEPGPLALALGENLRRIRREQGLTQAELGARLGIHRTRISLYEQARGNPTLTAVEQLADALGVGILELMTWPHHPTSSPGPDSGAT